MSETAQCQCQHCKTAMPVAYTRLGVPERCPACGHHTIPKIPDGGSVPAAGSALTYAAFTDLLADEPADEAVTRFLSTHFGYALRSHGTDQFVMNTTGEAVDDLWLHLEIQDSPELRGQLYDIVMSLRHS